MKINVPFFSLLLLSAVTVPAWPHDGGAAHTSDFAGQKSAAEIPQEVLQILQDGHGVLAAGSETISALTARYLSRRSNRAAEVRADLAAARWRSVTTPFNPLEALLPAPFALTAYTPPAGNGALMASSFGAFKPRVHFFWDGSTFYEESDNMPDSAMMPNLMVGITSWQQQVPLPAAYFASVVNPENSAASLGFGQPNYWRLPLSPTVAGSPTLIFTPGSATNNFQRGAIALASNGIAIFNPANNTGRVSYEIGELDSYGGHCGLADDYHYHIIPTHLSSRFGGPLTDDKPVAWALDGYPIYGYVEPNGTARQALDASGGHDIGNGWGYHYHAIGTTTVDAAHPYGTPQSPYTMTSFRGTVVNFGGQVDGQPEVGSLRASGTGGYTAQPVNGASIVAFKNPVALTTDGSGHLIENAGGAASPDSYLMRVSIGGTTYDECWKINRSVNPRTLTITWRLAGATTTTTYTPGNATAIARLATYGMADASQVKIPDTGQVLDTTATFGEDADYSLNTPSFTDNGNGTITDNVTGLMWQKVDNGESAWETAAANAASVATGGYTDWRLPTPSELFSIFNHNNGNPAALNATCFPNNPAGTAEYWWSSDVFGTSTTNVWCANAGGGLGGKPKAETISAGGTLRYHARYVRGAKPTNGHNFRNNGDGTITDLDTNLLWTQLPAPSTTTGATAGGAMNWEAALVYAENLTLAGYSDWRLPNIKELQTLTDYTLATATGTANIKPSINRQAFGRTLTNCATSSGSTTVTCADTTGLLVGMPIIDPSSIASAYVSNTTVPTVASVTNATTFVMSSAATGAGSGLSLKALAVPTAYWSSTSLAGGTTKAWLLETGVNNSVPAASGPTRGSQGIISYESKTLGAYPVFAVRSVSAGSITQGFATATTANFFPGGQRVSAVGSITATDGSTWTVPSATSFATAPKAADLYNEYNGVTPANIAAAQAAISSLPTQVIDADGEVVTGYIFSDNYFELYVNGVLIGVDPVPYTSFNSCVVKFKAKRPISYAVRLVDWEENLGVGTELNGGDPYHIGDGGFIASFSDGTVTNSEWKAQTFYIAPLDNPNQVVDLANGTHDSSASTTHSLNTTAYALHYPLPADWYAKTFSTAGWPSATTYTEAQVGINNIPAYTNFPAQFANSGAQFIWSSNLLLDNEVVVRYTGPAAAATQISVEQPGGTALADGASTVAFGSVSVGANLQKTFVIRNNGSTALSITGATIDGVSAANFTVATSPAASIAAGGNATMVVQFAPAVAGAGAAALHIACSDPSVGAAFDVNLTGTGSVPPPTITNVTTNPAVPSNVDTPYITATVTAASGATIAGVSLTYSTGAQTTGPAFREIFPSGSIVSGLAGSMNAWTSTAVRAAGDVKARGATGNRTAPIVLTNGATTNLSTTVTCASTANLIPGMLITGTGIPAGATVNSVSDATTFVISTAATATGTALSLTAAGATLTGCTTTTAGTSITCLSTTGLVAGMGIAGATTNPPNPTIASITDATHFVLNSAVTTGASNVTLTASGTGMALSNGTANFADTMAATTNAVSAVGPTSGNVEFYVRNADLISGGGWNFQISPDGGTTWNTRLSESFASASATNCTLNATTTVTCSNTSGLSVGNSIQGNPISIAACGTGTSTTVTTANTGGLAVGMFVGGPASAGIPANARITAINPGVSFTLSATTTATAANQTLTANYLPGNATIGSITPNVSFVLNTAAFVSGSGITLSSINHGFSLRHYDLISADMSANMKLRFQYGGYAGAVAPARPPEVDIDDIVVTLTTGATPVQVALFDDGLHGDGAAGDGVYGAQLPAFGAGTTVSYAIAATDNGSQTTTLASAGTYTTGLAPSITTNATLPNATPNAAFSTTLAATGGATGYGWSLVSGALPGGLSLGTGGVISGTPTAQGTFSFTIKVTDGAGRIATKTFALTVTTATPPNVVIILTDDQGWADVGYHTAAGQVPVQTPNMDRFGTDGIRLEKFYPTTVCAVSRGCLLTGRNSLRTGVGNQKGLGLAEHLMPQTFKSAGYQTFMCGKWHIGGWDNNIYTATVNGASIEVQHEGSEYHPLQRGWDFHKGQYGGAINYFTHTTSDPGKGGQVDWWQNGTPLPNDNTDLQGHGGYSTDLLADKAVEQIVGRDKSKPMLLYLAFNAIHAGVSAPQSYLDKYTALGVTNANRRTICAAVDCMDVAMGRVLAALDSEGITNNTLVIFMSDNGGDIATGALNSPLRGTKSDSYDGGLHTPAGIRWPGHLAAGVTSNQYVWIGDVFPTVCAAVGVIPQNTKPLDGVNLWPQMQAISAGNPNGGSRGVPLVTGAAAGPVALDTFTDPVNGGSKVFKLIRTPGTTETNQLFNMTDDPYEAADVLLGANAASYAAIVTTLTSAITGITPENFAPYIGPNGITQTVAAGGSITLYAPFSSYRAPTVQWRKNGANLSTASPFFQVTSGATPVNGVYMATLTLANAAAADSASYDVTVTSTSGTATSPAGTLTVLTAPVLPALPAFSAGTSRTLAWPAVTGAAFYNVEIATVADFSTTLATAAPTAPAVTFPGLTNGGTYYFRVRASAGGVLGNYSNVVSSTQDATLPVAAITSPANAGGSSTTHASVTVQGSTSDTVSGVASVTVNGVAATTGDGFAHWTATVPLSVGGNNLTAIATDAAGNFSTASVAISRTVSTANDGVPDSWKLARGIPVNASSAAYLYSYAFNLGVGSGAPNPVVPSVQSDPSDGLSYLTMSYPQVIGSLDLSYAIEVSPDASTWLPIGGNFQLLSASPNPDGITQNVSVRVLPSTVGVGQKFVRVRVTAQ